MKKILCAMLLLSACVMTAADKGEKSCSCCHDWRKGSARHHEQASQDGYLGMVEVNDETGEYRVDEDSRWDRGSARLNKKAKLDGRFGTIQVNEYGQYRRKKK